MNIENKTLNFLYCFDSNYNSQAYSSIASLLDSIGEKIKIFIIHNDLETLEDIPAYITNHKFLEDINFYKFTHNNIHFPNIDNTHISEATYYRLFIDHYLPDDISTIIYVDADMICINDPISEIRNQIISLKKTEFILSAKTEIKKNEAPENLEILMKNSFFKKYWPFERLSIDEKYFNAGFLIIDLDKWRNSKFGEKLLQKMRELKNKIVSWDQDVLNSVINGRYVELNKEFNYYMGHYKSDKNLIYFLHYSGSKKPWTTEGVFSEVSNFYHMNFAKVHNTFFHIEHNWKKHSLKQFINAVLTFRILKLNNPLIYSKEFIKSLIKE